MHKIEKKDYGFKLTFGDFIRAEEMATWVEEARDALKNAPGSFGVFVDMRSLKPLPEDSQAEMQKGQKLFKERGMQRSVVVVNSPTTKIQFKRIAKETGIYQWERYVDASSAENWQKVAEDWIVNKVDPDA